MGGMPLPRAVLRPALAATAAAATALTLAACGTGTGASGDPTETIPSQIGAPSSTPTPSAPVTSASPTTTSAAPVTSPPSTTAASTTPTAAKILDFKGIQLMLPVEQSDLPGIPDSLRSALAAALKKRWDAYGDAPACQKGPVYVINKVDTGGWASIDSWDNPGVSGPKCSGVGGGYDGFWASVNGTWQEVIQTQELPECTQFEKYHFPVAIVGDKCTAPDGSAVTYAG